MTIHRSPLTYAAPAVAGHGRRIRQGLASAAIALAIAATAWATPTDDVFAAHGAVAGKRASFTQPVSDDVRTLADSVAGSADHGERPFYIIDKQNARLHVFDADARLVATSPVLLGAARGDDSVPGIGDRKMSEILPHERTTPAGRFVGERGRNHTGETIVWIDYDAAVSMHRVRAHVRHERRLERLASATSDDNRISYGCINVPAAFFDAHVWPVFGDGRKAMIYVLPETRPLERVFTLAGTRQLARTLPDPGR